MVDVDTDTPLMTTQDLTTIYNKFKLICLTLIKKCIRDSSHTLYENHFCDPVTRKRLINDIFDFIVMDYIIKEQKVFSKFHFMTDEILVNKRKRKVMVSVDAVVNLL